MNNADFVACVTGASGKIGSKIVQQLLNAGYKVRVLSRKPVLNNPDLVAFQGDIRDEVILTKFLKNAHLLFHCAAELNDQSLMWEVNVEGTKLLFDLAARAKIPFCGLLSSAVVVGPTDQRWVNEETPCNPQGLYGKSKWAAERFAFQGIGNARVIILRPTNVIDDNGPGAALALPNRGSWLDRLQVLIKGVECAHIIHAEDVAAAAVFSISLAPASPQIYIVSCDHEPYNTFAGLWSLYRACQAHKPVENLKPVWHLPELVPYALRRLLKVQGNRMRYSSAKLMAAGFRFPLGIGGAVQRVIATNWNR